MIINLFGKVTDDVIEFESTPVYFENNQFVHVNEIFIEWKSNISTIHGFITSSLVDLCPVNPKQQLIFFHQDKNSKYLHVTPTHHQKYKIQCPSLHSSLFQIDLSKPQEIEKIYIQIEISNARN